MDVVNAAAMVTVYQLIFKESCCILMVWGLKTWKHSF